MPSESTTTDLIHSIYALLGAREIADGQPLLGDELAVEEVTGSDSVSIGSGRVGLASLLGRYDEQFREFRIEPVEVVVIGDRALVKVRIGGVGVSGAEQWGTGYHLHTLAGGRLVRLQLFADPAEAARAAGLDGSG